MSEIKLTALVLLPAGGDEAVNERVYEICSECLDLADVKPDRPSRDANITPDNRWVAMDGKLVVSDFVMVDLSRIDGTIPPDLLVQATIARFANGKPVLVLLRDEPALPLGWHHHADVFRYTPDDEGFTALKKALNRRLVSLVSEVEERLIAGANQAGGNPAAAAAAATPAAAPAKAGASAAAGAGAASAGAGGAGAIPSEEEEARIKAVLRERFRRRLEGDVDTAEQAEANKREDKARNVESALKAGEDPTRTRMVRRPDGAPGGEAGELNEEAKRSRLLELQEKLKRNEAQAAASASADASTDGDELGFDLNIDLDGDAPVKVTSGLSSKVRAGELMAEQVKPKSPAASSDGEDEEEEADDFELDASDIDILQDIRSAEKRKKKKKKKKRPAGAGPAAASGAGAGAAPGAGTGAGAGGGSGAAAPAASASRSGLGMLTDKRTGQRLELRKEEMTVGRVAGNDLMLTEGQVSSRHCKIFRRENAYFILDLGSTNGTYVNNELVSSKQAVRLKDDDRIVVARTKELPNGAREFVFNQHP